MLKLFWCAVVMLSMMTPAVLSQDESDETTHITSVAWSPDGDKIATATNTGRLYVWDVATDSLLREFQAHEGAIYSLSWNPDGARLASISSHDGLMRIWNTTYSNLIAELTTDRNSLDGALAAWNPNGKMIVSVTANTDGGFPLHFWRIEGGDFEQLPTTYNAAAYDLAWNPDGTQLVIADYKGVFIFDDFSETTLEPRFIAPFHFTSVWSPDGTKLVAVEALTDVVNIIDVDTGQTLLSVQSWIERIASVAWSPDGTTLIADHFNGTVQSWDALSGELLQTLSPERQGGRFLMSLSPYGGQLALGNSADTAARNQTDNGFQIVVPAPSLDRLAAIAALCVRDGDARAESLTDSVPTALDDLPAFVAQVEALPDGAIPPACKADVLAVASALGD